MKKPDGKFVIFKQNLYGERQWAVSFVIAEDVEGEVNVPSLHSEGLHKTYDSREELIMRINSLHPDVDIYEIGDEDESKISGTDSIIIPVIIDENTLYHKSMFSIINLNPIYLNGEFVDRISKGTFVVFLDEYPFEGRLWYWTFITENMTINENDIGTSLYENYTTKEEAVMNILLHHPKSNIMIHSIKEPPYTRDYVLAPGLCFGKLEEMRFAGDLEPVVRDGEVVRA